MMFATSPTRHTAVIPRLGLGIHEFLSVTEIRPGKLVDAKAKPWHDGEEGGYTGAYIKGAGSAVCGTSG